MSYVNHRLHRLVADWPGLARIGAASLRAELAARPSDQALRALIAELCTSSAEFRDAWPLQEVHRFRSQNLTLRDAALGTLHLEIDKLVPNDDASATIVVYSPTDAESRARLPTWIAAASSTMPR
jgi:hypothetical protein